MYPKVLKTNSFKMKPFRPVSSVQESFDSFFSPEHSAIFKGMHDFSDIFFWFSFLAQKSDYKNYVNNFYYAKEAVCSVKTLLP